MMAEGYGYPADGCGLVRARSAWRFSAFWKNRLFGT